MSERKDTLQKYASDMIALNKHIREAIERQLNTDSLKHDPIGFPLVSRIDGVLEHQIAEMERHVEALGGDPGSPVKDAVSSVLGFAAGIIDKVRTDTVSKILRDDYTALSLAAMGHTMLHTTGLALKDQATADIALRQLREITPILVDISEQIPRVVVKELHDDSEIIDSSVADEAVRNTQQAWSREHVG